MKAFGLLALSFLLLQTGLAAPEVTVTEFITVAPSATQAGLQDSTPISTPQTTFATVVKGTPLAPSSASSIVPSTSAVSQSTGSASVSAASQDSGASNDSGSGGGAIDTDAGASGSESGAFSLSKGGLIAIIIVVVLVVLFGIVSIVLYIVAKRRQWNVRASIARASRRLTGRRGDGPSRAADVDRRSRRTGVYAGGVSKPGVQALKPPGHTRGLVVEVKDVEKAPASTYTKSSENTWMKKVWGKGWK